MSKSRLEKFLYALYSLDSSDLPNPLSRIEELYKCLVTGEEAPTLEPLSRVEKYLMAILGAYDADSLPNPLSRVEVLLYKLATGDDNLDDVKSFLSEHEELLAEIIRNGGIGENIDIEYVLYTLLTEHNTLYNTSEKPVKSAILKGRTLVNLSKTNMVNLENGRMQNIELNMNLEVGKSYTLITNNSNNDETGVTLYGVTDSRQLMLAVIKGNGVSKLLISASKITNTINNLRIQINVSDYENGKRGLFENIMIIEGDYTNLDIPYFEGMQTVKMPVLKTTGKNLFDSELEVGGLNSTTGGNEDDQDDRIRTKDYIKVKPDTYYIIIRTKYKSTWAVRYYDENYNHISPHIYNESNVMLFKTSANVHYIRMVDMTNDLNNLYQLEEGEQATTYEPHKSNILTVNEEIELREVNGVHDELNLLTGEVTQRIGEIVFDGSENWSGSTVGSAGTFMRFRTIVQDAYLNEKGSGILCDRFTSISHNNWNMAIEGIHSKQTEIHINIPTSKLESNDASGFKKWLSSNPVAVCYTLATESIKTVDLSVVDQDENNTKLSTFDDITHVTLSSEGLIPEAELEVSTKNEEVLNTMGLEMDDISTTQNALKETSNTQSENVDATMLATTEIYEGLL